jgi:hypothetical protein
VNDTYTETGGLRWGESFWGATNATWPFATLHASKDGLRIDLSVLRLWRRRFELTLSDIQALRKKRWLFSAGLLVEHSRSDYPQFILFWTFRYSTLKTRLNQLGYTVFDQEA